MSLEVDISFGVMNTILAFYAWPEIALKKKRRFSQQLRALSYFRAIFSARNLVIYTAVVVHFLHSYWSDIHLHPGGRGGTLGISGWGCAAGTLEHFTYTRASLSEFCYPIITRIYIQDILSALIKVKGFRVPAAHPHPEIPKVPPPPPPGEPR